VRDIEDEMWAFSGVKESINAGKVGKTKGGFAGFDGSLSCGMVGETNNIFQRLGLRILIGEFYFGG